MSDVAAQETFGERLRRLRRDAGFSQEGLAQEARISRQTVYTAERGTTIPDLETAWALADALGIALDKLVGRTVPKEKAAPARPSRFSHLSSGASEEANAESGKVRPVTSPHSPLCNLDATESSQDSAAA